MCLTRSYPDVLAATPSGAGVPLVSPLLYADDLDVDDFISVSGGPDLLVTLQGFDVERAPRHNMHRRVCFLSPGAQDARASPSKGQAVTFKTCL